MIKIKTHVQRILGDFFVSYYFCFVSQHVPKYLLRATTDEQIVNHRSDSSSATVSKLSTASSLLHSFSVSCLTFSMMCFCVFHRHKETETKKEITPDTNKLRGCWKCLCQRCPQGGSIVLVASSCKVPPHVKELYLSLQLFSCLLLQC